MKPTLEARDLAIGYRRRKADLTLAAGLNLELRPGALVGLLGPNGIGKSTLLWTLAGMHKPLAGRILLGACDVTRMNPAQRARRLSLVLTQAPAVDLMNGYGLVALGRQPHNDWLGRLSERDRAVVEWALRAVNGAELARKNIAELSDGQRQKLMIARALAQECAVMLLDEATAYLDVKRRFETMRLLRQLTRSAGKAILASTHDLDLALRYCDRLWLMSDAGLLQGAPDYLLRSGELNRAFQLESLDVEMNPGE